MRGPTEPKITKDDENHATKTILYLVGAAVGVFLSVLALLSAIRNH
jgi:hypothetical protein